MKDKRYKSRDELVWKKNHWTWVKPVTSLVTFISFIALMVIVFGHDLGLFSYFTSTTLYKMNIAALASAFFFFWSLSDDEVGPWYTE